MPVILGRLQFFNSTTSHSLSSHSFIVYLLVATMSTDEAFLLEALFHHLVLPPKLPRTFDGDNSTLARNLGERLQHALGRFRGIGDPKVWQTLEASLHATKNLHDGPLYQDDLFCALKNVQRSDGSVWLAIHLVPQNAALIIRGDPA
jgi:hypothetical protein